jgi:hypothetical protein
VQMVLLLWEDQEAVLGREALVVAVEVEAEAEVGGARELDEVAEARQEEEVGEVDVLGEGLVSQPSSLR